MNSKTTILNLSQIREYLKSIDLIPIIEKGFEAYSDGLAVVPPVGELIFEQPPGETHIKYGYIKGQDYFTVKIASGFYNNPQINLKSSQGIVLLFDQRTGEVCCVFLDEGLLTDVRTAIASMITLKYLAPEKINRIGIVGTGIQAKLQLEYLDQVSDCRNVTVWGRTPGNVNAFLHDFTGSDYNIDIAESIEVLCRLCDVIITTTSATSPLIKYEYMQSGTHITALGSDTADKIELSPEILENADLIISDSLAQSQHRGEIYQARKSGHLDESKLLELGNLIKDSSHGRKNTSQITVADLSGVAVQDIMIATAIFDHHKSISL